MKLSTLLHNHVKFDTKYDREVIGLANDSRKVKPGFIFFAYPGVATDGRHYIDQAIAHGATVVVAQGDSIPCFVSEQNDGVVQICLNHCQALVSDISSTFYGNPTQDMKIIGVTGTNGKTSVVYLLAQCLHYLGKKIASVGTLGAGIYPQLSSTHMTTPDPICLMQQMAFYKQANVEVVVMEVSSHSLSQDRVAAIPFTMAVFTNLTRDHLDYHNSLDDYCAAKARLFTCASLEYAFINGDDPREKAIKCSESIRHTYQYAQAHDVKLTSTGLAFSYHFIAFHCNLLGQFSVYNVLAVIHVLQAMNYPLETISQAVAACQSVPGRMELITKEGKPVCIVDYAHTPDALDNVLRSAKQLCRGELICVFGCGGDRDRGKRALMAKVAQTYASTIYVTSDNPRTEHPQQIFSDIYQGFSGAVPVEKIEDRRMAIIQAINQASVNDIVVVAGKGHENYQVFGDDKVFFSDIEQVNLVLESR